MNATLCVVAKKSLISIIYCINDFRKYQPLSSFLGPCSSVDLLLGRCSPSGHRRSWRTEHLSTETRTAREFADPELNNCCPRCPLLTLRGPPLLFLWLYFPNGVHTTLCSVTRMLIVLQDKSFTRFVLVSTETAMAHLVRRANTTGEASIISY